MKVTIKNSVVILLIWFLTGCGGSGNTAEELQPDIVAPVITLNGETYVSLFMGDTYIEESASAVDDVDGQLTVTISGEIDFNAVGIYTLTYTAMDAAGNESSVDRKETACSLTATLKSNHLGPN